MSISTVTIPTGFQPIAGNDLIYTFTEGSLAGKVNYRLEIEIWDSDAASVLFGGLKFQFSPNSAGAISANIADPLRSLLSFGDVGDVTSVKNLTNHYRNIYIKYQAVWDASSDAQVSLSASVATIFNGSKHRLTDRVGTFPAEFTFDDTVSGGRPFQTSFKNVPGWTGYPMFIDGLVKSSSKNGHLLIAKDHTLGNTQVGTWMRRKIPVENKTRVLGTRWTPGLAGNYIAWYQSDCSTFDWSTVNQQLFQLYYNVAIKDLAMTFTGVASMNRSAFILYGVGKVGNPTNTINFRVEQTTAGLPNGTVVTGFNTNLKIEQHVDGEDMVIEFTGNSVGLTNGTVYALVISPNNDGVSDASNYLNFPATTSSVYAGGNVCTHAGAWSAVAAADLNGGVFYSTLPNGQLGIRLGASIPIEVRTAGDNVVHLTWLTDMGGRLAYVFDCSQEEGYRLDSTLQRRYGILKCYATMVPFEDWIAINELNKVGDRFGDYKKIGQRVLDLTQLSGYQEVWVVPTVDRALTRQIRATAEVNIEYKELPQNRVSP